MEALRAEVSRLNISNLEITAIKATMAELEKQTETLRSALAESETSALRAASSIEAKTQTIGSMKTELEFMEKSLLAAQRELGQTKDKIQEHEATEKERAKAARQLEDTISTLRLENLEQV